MMMGGAAPSPSSPAPSPQPSPKAASPAKKPPELQTVRGSMLTVPYTVHIAGDAADRGSAEMVIEGVFATVDTTFTPECYNPKSEVAALNHLQPGERRALSPPMAEVLRITEAAYKATDGRFDPTVGPVVRAWEELCAQAPCGDADVCAIGEIMPQRPEELRQGVGWAESFRLLDGGRSVQKLRAAALDLSGVAKGWCVDEIVRRLADAGFSDVFVDWGGDCRAAGAHPAGRPWRLAVAAPPPLRKLFKAWKSQAPGLGGRRGSLDVIPRCTETDSGHEKDALHCVELVGGGALATSGDFGRPWRYGYYGIVDPLSAKLEPRRAGDNRTCLATVGCASCAEADALATALMTFPSPQDAARAAAEWLHSGARWPEGGAKQLIFASRAGGKLVARDEAAGVAPAQPVSGRQLRAVVRSLPQPVSVVVPLAAPECAATVEALICPLPGGRTVVVGVQRPSRVQVALTPGSGMDAHLLDHGGLRLAERCAAGGSPDPGELLGYPESLHALTQLAAPDRGAGLRAAALAAAKEAVVARVVAEEPAGDHVLALAEALTPRPLPARRWLLSAHGADGRWYRPLSSPRAVPPSPAAFAVGKGSRAVPLLRLSQASTAPAMVQFAVAPSAVAAARDLLGLSRAGDPQHAAQPFSILPLAAAPQGALAKRVKRAYSDGDCDAVPRGDIGAAGGELECRAVHIVRPLQAGGAAPSGMLVIAEVVSVKPPGDAHPERPLIDDAGDTCTLAPALSS
eukprot:TRINITY_DN38891_c0_g1_i2.p1 TRINITY_DN38891_c0_g1~~TRINITY_DN38891_c0_g1_i2.p1  ORF type:complete len:785 (+),score=123.76 TRINITY_DN38891_c0_g1_i2:127-2355(+)